MKKQFQSHKACCFVLLVFTLLFGFTPNNSTAQMPNSVDIGLYEAVPGTLEVRVTPNGSSFNELVSSISFTLQWETASGLSLGSVNQNINGNFCPLLTTGVTPNPQGVVTDAQFSYQNYNVISTTQLQNCATNAGYSWPANVETVIAEIPYSGVNGCAELNIVSNAFTAANNYNFFVSLNALNKTGSIVSSNILSQGATCDDGDASTGNDALDANCNCVGQLIDCDGIAGGSALPGATCDDGDATTGNDVYDVNCNCAGLLIDCAGLAGGSDLPGASCDDGNSNTTSDVWDANCNCAGLLIDCEGVPAGSALPGTACDDGDAATGNDTYDTNCNCIGQLIDCEGVAGGSDLPGASCDDGDATTGNDTYDSNCNCAGLLIDCEGVAGGSALPSAACDDGDATTGNDVYDANCNCAGQLIDCVGVPGGFTLPGSSCDDGDAGTGNDVYDANCNCAGQLIDCEGVAGGSDLPGASCDDGDATTGNDVYDANCNCAGQLIDCEGVAGGSAVPGTSCDDGDATTGNDTYDANCICAGLLIDCEGTAGGNALPGTSCDDGDAGTGNDVYDANCNCAGQLIDCVGVIGGSTLPGSSCDDGDATTGNDLYDANCNCVGQLIDCEGVAGGSALPGATCDDGDATTGNDVYDANCNCVGSLIDCNGVAGGNAFAGSPCDDGDATTGNDVFDTNCNCAGLLIDCIGVPGGTTLPGSSCDDGDATTGNDTYDANCNCAGLLIDCVGVPGGTTLPGSSCDDGDATTGNDVYDGNCNCAGLPLDCQGVPGGNAVAGTSCDDGNAATFNDVYDASCNCAGLLCDPNDPQQDCDNDGIVNGIDCDPADATINYGVGSACDDGDISTAGDVYDANCNCVGTAPNCAVGYYLEAECATIGSTWFVDQNASASNGLQVNTPNNLSNQTSNPPTGVEDRITFTLDLGIGGQFYLWSRAISTGFGQDSFWVRANGGNWIKYNNIPITGVLSWDDLHNSDVNDNVAVLLPLVAGTNTIDFTYRETGVVLDKIFLTCGSTVPTGAGGAATNCPDNDGDGIFDTADLDDDNDGLLDTEEQNCTTNAITGYAVNASGSFYGSASNATGAFNNASVEIAVSAHTLILELGNVVQTGDTYDIRWRKESILAFGNANMSLDLSIDGNNWTASPNQPSTGSTSFVTQSFQAPFPFKYLRMELPSSLSPDYDVDGVRYQTNSTTCVDIDTDGDGLADRLDIDSDGDGCFDVVEAGFTDANGDGELDGTGYNVDGTVAGAVDGYTGTTPAVTDVNITNCASDCEGVIGGTALPGTPCDDGNPATGNDTYNVNCTCIGQVIDCNGIVGGGALPGEFCNDGDITTSNDVWDNNCNCAGVFADADGDGIWDGADLDLDNDGILNVNDGCGSYIITSPLFSTPEVTGTNTDLFDLTGLANIGDQVFLSELVADGDLNSSNIEFFSLNVNNGQFVADSLSSGQQCSGLLPMLNPINASVTVTDIGGGTPGLILLTQSSAGVNSLPGCLDGILYTVNVSDGTSIDTDGDGIVDCMDTDSDGDGCLDVLEAGYTDNDGNGVVDGTGFNTDGTVAGSDGYQGTSPIVTNAALVAPACDTDADGIPASVDLDDDNDGLFDTEEGYSAYTFTSPLYVVPDQAQDTLLALDLSSYGVLIGESVTLSGFVANGDMDLTTENFDLDFNNGQSVQTGLETGSQCSGLVPLTNPITVTVSAIDIGGGIPGITILATSSQAVNALSGCANGIDLQFTVSGGTTQDSDSDGIPDYLDIDSDNDGCLDVTEAGFTDANADGELDGTGYNADGTVAGAPDGYTGTDPAVTDPNIAACSLDCEGVAGGNALPGTSCDDGDATTTNDVYDANCNCAGQLVDCEGVAGGNALPGTSCDDGDASTGNDTYDANCNCIGQLIDCEGVAGGTALPGTSCDDGDATTGNDVYDANCNCAGQLLDCQGVAGGTALPGTSCEDGDPNTINDVYQTDCTCAGILLTLDCEGVPGGNALPGTPCDDGDPNTGGDKWDVNCNCAGQLIDCEGVAGGNALPGTACDDGDVSTINDTYDANCNCAGVNGTVDCEGVAGGSALPGTACDDGDFTTGNDTYDTNCNCVGLLIDCFGVPGGPEFPGASCDDGNPGTVNDTWTNDCNCVGTPADCEGVPGGNATPGTLCDDGDPLTVGEFWDASCNCGGGTVVDCNGIQGGTALPGTDCDDGDVLTNNDVWDANCNCSGVLIDCEGVQGGTAFPGTSCDDGDPNTINDVYDANCNCGGQAPDCEGVLGGLALPGTACDDGDNTTINDVYDANCNCAGISTTVDCEGVAGGTALPGTACDDGDFTTGNDTYDTNCNCVGLLIDCFGVPGGPEFPGASCDDGNPGTVNDTWTNDCNCVGTPADCEGVPGGTATPGTLCDDGDPLTVGEFWDASCNCGGGTVVDCNGIQDGTALPGTSCDDNDPLTSNDVFDANCNCAGALIDCEGVANGTALPGTSCDDGDPLTTNDVYDANCNCAGSGSGPVTVCFNLGTSSDSDVEESSAGVYLDADNLDLVLDSELPWQWRGNQNIGLLFEGVSVPQGASIINAYIQFTAADTFNYNPIQLNIAGDASDNANPMSFNAGTVSGRTSTNTNIAWSPNDWNVIDEAGPDQRTPNLALIVQEIVNRAGWNATNDMAFMIDGFGGRQAYSSNQDASKAAVLCITYSTQALPPDCEGVAGGSALPGTSCDDGDANTVNDVFDANCNCAGDVLDCLGVVNGTALPGTPCDDGNANTGLDVYDALCNCSGVLIDCEGLIGGNALPGTPCDDGDASTNNDTYDGSCNCAGTANTQTICFSLGTSSDPDVEESTTGVYQNAGNLDLVLDSELPYQWRGNQNVGLHFEGISVPQGASILNAYIQFTAADTFNYNPVQLNIAADASDNAALLSFTAGTVSGRTPTSATVAWSPSDWTLVDEAGLDQRTPNLAAMVQEIVNRAGWVDGNDMAFMIDGIGGRQAYSSNQDPSKAAQLCITFSTEQLPLDCEGIAGGNAVPGAPCDDGDANTVNDSYDANCNCAGDPVDCAGVVNGTALPGTACDDGNANTGNDVYDANCNCAGLVIDCEGVPGGTAVLDDCGVCNGNNDCLGGLTCYDLGTSTDSDREEAFNGGVYEDAGNLDLVLDSELPYQWRGDQVVGLRFEGLNIPAGAIITGARLQFTAADTVNYNPCNINIAAEAADDAPALSFPLNSISSRGLTNNSVAWSPSNWDVLDESGSDQRSPDLSAVLQEIVDRPGWADGNAMVFVISGTGGRQAYSSDQDPSKAAKLCLSWELPIASLHVTGRSLENTSMSATLYPNPNRGDLVYMNLNNQLEESTEGSIMISDMYGKEIHVANIIVNPGQHQEILELQGLLAQGVYLVHVLVDGEMITERLVIQ